MSYKIKSNEDAEILNNVHQVRHASLETSREKDKMRIKELESETRVLQVCS